MRKLTSLLLVLVLMLGMTACGTQSPTAAPSTATPEPAASSEAAPVDSETPAKTTGRYIGYATLTTQGDFMSTLATELETRFTALGDKFEVASADMSPQKQIEQIENFISLGVDALIILAVDSTSLSDVLKKAEAAGIKIIGFSQPLPSYDLYLGADDYALGMKEAEMAAEWIDKTFPDAPDGSIEVAIFENRDKPMAATRSDGFKEITNLTKKATIATTVGVDTTNAGGQSAAENLMLSHPDVKVILSYNGDTAMGVDAYAMSLNSAIKDKAAFATFGIDFNGAAIDAIQKSANNESVWRGTIMMGKSLEAMYEEVVFYTLKCMEGTLENRDQYTDLYKITPENIHKVFDGTIS